VGIAMVAKPGTGPYPQLTEFSPQSDNLLFLGSFEYYRDILM
jgi:hypothetical protein